MSFFILQSNPFFDAYMESDFIGKLIFLGLIALSIITWSVLIHKLWVIKRVEKSSLLFRKSFAEQRQNPLDVNYHSKKEPECPNAFYIIYELIKTKTIEVLDKNQKVTCSTKKGFSSDGYLSPSDIALLDSCGQSTISSLTKYLDKNLYILSTVVTLAPFLGLLGTVYGILTTFSSMNGDAQSAISNQAVLGGLSLALTTTVVGLIDAIPALIGYNYLKNRVHDFDTEMGRFANDVLSSVELHYRKVE